MPPPAQPRAVAVAALSARPLAEAAVAAGFEVIALDVFGDADTRAAASAWLPIGKPGRLEVDGSRLHAALEGLAREGRVQAWLAGAGFEAVPQALQQGADVLPLLGSAPAAQARARDPRTFFNALQRLGLPHPQTRFEGAGDMRGWLRKNAAACGGLHIRRGRAQSAALRRPQQVWQREVRGTPMSATCVAVAGGARLLGINQQLVHAAGRRPFVFAGVLGPVPVSAALREQVAAAAAALCEAFALRGLVSLDFMLDEAGMPQFLELNPRPSASMVLYPQPGGLPLLHWHLRACGGQPLPADAGQGAEVRGQNIIFARRALSIGEDAARWLAAQPHVHDRPQPGQPVAVGEPLCTVSARGASAQAVQRQFELSAQEIHNQLETQA